MRSVKYASVVIAALVTYATVFGQSGDFQTKGRAVTTGGVGIPMATVTYNNIAKRLSWDFSKADGSFGGYGVVSTLPRTQDARITLPAKGPVAIDIFNVGGKKITTVSGRLDKGTYILRPFSVKLAQTMYLLKIKAGNKVTYQKLLATGNSRSGFTIPLSSPNAIAVLAKKLAAAIDTVRVGKNGYAPAYVPISSYTDEIGNVILDTVNVEAEIATLMGQMSQTEIVSQLAMPQLPIASKAVAQSLYGSVFGGGGVFAGYTASSCADTVDSIQVAMMNTARKIPILCGSTSAHGAGAIPGATIFPHNMALGAIQDTLLVQKAFRVTAIEVRGSGMNWIHDPCIAVVRDDRWGRTYEGFSETPEKTAIMARHAVLGVQTTDLSLNSAVLATVKHFAGDGNTDGGVNAGTTQGPDSLARAINLPGYTSAVAAGVGCVMASFSRWCDNTPMHQNKTLMTDWLKSTAAGNPGFQGFIVGNYNGLSASLQTCEDAGLDVPMQPGTDMVSAFTGFYAADSARLYDACKRMLRVKFWMNQFSNFLTDRRLTGVVGSAIHRAVARQCVQQSLVLLKDTNSVLPIPKTANVAIWGQGGDDVGIQCGGWTVSWQGSAGTPTPGGTTIRQGVEALCSGAVTFSDSGSNVGNADYIIAVLSEQPYAENSFTDINLINDVANVGYGGASGQKATPTNAAVIAAIQTAHAAGKKVIVVLMAGRPMDISAVLSNCDAFVWASLPGTEGNGVADVLFGDQGLRFTGKLPITWPMNNAQEPINIGDGKTGLFAYGFGLTD